MITTALLNPHMFRAYDIRGLAGEDLSPAIAERIGAAFATYLRRRGGQDAGRRPGQSPIFP